MSKNRHRVLFVCVHNSFRSQIAEAILNYKYGDLFEAESAGFSTDKLHPLAIEAMQDYGIDLSDKKADKVFDFFLEGRLYDYVITVCSKEAEKRCPIFPGVRKRINWNLEDPENFSGTHEERLNMAIRLRDEIEARIDAFANPTD